MLMIRIVHHHQFAIPEKKLDQALEFFGFPLEAPTYNALIGAYCWSKRVEEAFKIVEEMRVNGVGPNARTYDVILHHLVRMQRTKEAYEVYQKMSCEPTVSTYEILVRMFCYVERLDMAVKVWDEMKGKGAPGHMFSRLKEALLDDGRKEKVVELAVKMDRLRKTQLLG
ncbi:unnamed protein product [Microthlaspi erraticum]|uniref:Pentacotripeptide-repeat region of PRORP domain-containing protein n=1 Tax=Microthlaspi erraticum TaxID=1685480 RepID=A0A6D2KK56_9BRAS|nr:unnamed protein product [Microthlaspi erraticum]